MTIRNKKTGAIYSSDTLIDDSRYGEYYDSAVQVNGEYGSVTLSFPSGEWEEVNEQWHDLRKDPTDVPNNDRDVWACFISQNKKYYDQAFYSEGKWRTMFSAFACTSPDAWCEIPKFEEE